MTQVDPLFFIVGRGRSGTTLLSRMLAQHSELSVAPEGFFAMNLRGRFGSVAWTENIIAEFCDALLLENRMKAWGLDASEVATRLGAALPELDYRRACEIVYRCHAEVTLGKPTARLFGDKNPHYSLLTKSLLQQFPGARFIQMVRDPRDNVLSFRSVPFDVNSIPALAVRWRIYNALMARVARSAPERFLRVHYEALVAKPTEELTRICDFLGVKFEPQMLEYFDKPQVDFYGAGSEWFSQLNQPVDGRHVNKWARAFAVDELAVIEKLCGTTMADLGYVSTEAATVGRLPIAAVGAAAAGAVGLALERVLFSALPMRARTELINRHREKSGRV